MAIDIPIKQVVVVDKDAMYTDRVAEHVAFFNEDGTPYEGLPSDAGDIDFTPAGTIAADNVQDAIEEVASEAKVFTAIVTATAIGTAAKTTVTAEPAAGTLFVLKFTNGNSAASPTIAFNGGSARAIQLGGAAPSGAEATIAAAGVGLYWFDGTVVHQVGVLS